MSDIERRDAQGEDERALREALKQIRDYPGTSRAADYMRRIAREALRSRPAKPFLEENVDRWLDGEATGLVNALWAKIDESYADRNGNGETERVVRESHEIAKQWLIETFADLRAALRSRLAEPVITREEIECMPLVSTLPYPKPAMSEEDERLPTARDAKELVEHIMATWGEQQYDVINEIDRYVAMRIRAALASDRARREDEARPDKDDSDRVMMACEYYKDRVKDPRPLSAYRRVLACINAHPAPDVAVLREAAQGLLDLMDEAPIDPSLGEETDRVFSRAEFGALRKALGGEA